MLPAKNGRLRAIYHFPKWWVQKLCCENMEKKSVFNITLYFKQGYHIVHSCEVKSQKSAIKRLNWNKFTDSCLMDEFPNPSAKEQATIWVVLCAKDGKIRHIIVLSYEPNFSLFSSQHYSKSCWLLSWGVGKFVRRTTVNRPEDHYGQVLYIYFSFSKVNWKRSHQS